MLYELTAACFYIGAVTVGLPLCDMPKWDGITFDDRNACESAARALTKPPLQALCSEKQADIKSR